MSGRRATHTPRVGVLRSRRVVIALLLAPVAVAVLGVGTSSGAGSAPAAGERTTAASATSPTARKTPARKAPVGRSAPAQTFTDVAYARLSPTQTLDLYLPRRTGKAVPLVIDIHGGAFMGGNKSDARERIEGLVAAGYAVASLNYRLLDEAPFPAGVKDVKAAVRWLRASAPRYGIDPGRFAAWGDSAGGYFAVMLGATSNLRTAFDDPALGNAGVSSAVQSVVDFYGPVNFLTMDRHVVSPGGCPADPQLHNDASSPESLWLGAPVQSVPALAKAANPLTYLAVKGTRPAFLIAHGKADCLVPHGQSLELARALKVRRTPNSTYVLPGLDHVDPRVEQRMQPLVRAFLKRTLTGA